MGQLWKTLVAVVMVTSLLACDDPAPGSSCGEGTVDVDGVCVPEPTDVGGEDVRGDSDTGDREPDVGRDAPPEDVDAADSADTPDVRDTDAAEDVGDPDTGEPGVDPRDPCPPLGEPTGELITLTPEDAGAFTQIFAQVESHTTFLLRPGTYELDGQYAWISAPNVTVRGATGNRADVVVDGGYVSTEIFTVAADNVTIADLTIHRAFTHGVHVVGSEGTTKNTLLYNVHVLDPGEQAIKINQSGQTYADGGTVACSALTLTDDGRPHIRNNCYTGGIDAHQSRGWHIRDNWIEGFWCEAGLSEHGIHFWRANADAVVERNTILNCARGIGLGLVTEGIENIRAYDDIDECQGFDYLDDYRGTIRNNFVAASDARLFASGGGFDSGISVWNACGATIAHNTVWSSQAPFTSIEWRFPNSSVTVANNLVSHNLAERNPGIGTQVTNVDGFSDAAAFADAPAGDLHLVGPSVADGAGTAGWAHTDIDGEDRPDAPSVGADER